MPHKFPTNHPCRLTLAVFATCFVTLGCGSSNMAPATGTVKRDGKPVPAGRVIFSPIADGKPAYGDIRPDGSFTMMTARPDDGANIGSYYVTIAGQRDAPDAASRATYLGPRDKPLQVAAGANNEFVLDISKKTGWQAVAGN